MNKIFQKMSMAALALLSVLALASCDAGDEDYTAGAPDPGYYLSASSTSLTYSSDENQVLALVVGRTDSRYGKLDERQSRFPGSLFGGLRRR